MKYVPLLALNLALAACACGDAGDPHDPAFEGSDGVEPMRVQEDVLAEINVGNQTVKFLQLGEGEEAALILTTSGNIDEGNVVDSLRAAAGELTLLEIFQALAPADQEPPPALVHAHADEVIALGRDGDQIRVVEKAQTPPPGVSPCADSLHFPAPFVWSPAFGTAAPGGIHYLCTGAPIQTGGGDPQSTACTHFTTSRQRVGICDGDVNVVGYAGYGTQGGGWFATANVAVPSGQYQTWDWGPSATMRRLAAVGRAPAGQFYGLRSGIGQ